MAHKQQIFAAAAVIALGLCAVAFVATSGDASPAEDSISNIYAGYAKQAALHRHTTKLAMGPGLEADDMKDIQTAWITFKDSRRRRGERVDRLGSQGGGRKGADSDRRHEG